MKKVIAAAALISCLLFASSAQAEIIASSGFKVNPNGFSFANYAAEPGIQNLDAVAMQQTFGSGVCVNPRGKCVLTYPARVQMHSLNEAMGGGHCFGMAQLGLMMKTNKLPQFGYPGMSVFGNSNTAFGLTIDNNRPLQRAIARAFIAQMFPEMTAASKNNFTPNQVLNFLIKNLKNINQEAYSFSIFQPDFTHGHAVTPYAVNRVGNGIFEILVYDNNWPNDTSRKITINRNKNTWEYYGNTMSGDDIHHYVGTAKSKTLILNPISPQFGVQNCDFCIAGQGKKSNYNTITLSSNAVKHSHVLIIDQKGRKLGIKGNKVYRQIPGGKIVPRTSGGGRVGSKLLEDSLEPVYMVPKNLSFQVHINGRAPSNESLSVVGPQLDIYFNNIVNNKRQLVVVGVNSKRKKAFIRTNRFKRSRPQVTLSTESKTAAYKVNIVPEKAAKGRKVMLAFKKGKVNIASAIKRSNSYSFTINKFSERGQEMFNKTIRYNSKRLRAAFNLTALKRNNPARVSLTSKKTGKQVKVYVIK